MEKKKWEVKTLSRLSFGFFTFYFRVFHVQLFFSRSIFRFFTSRFFFSRSIFAFFTSRFRRVRSRKREVNSSDRISAFIPHTRYKSRNSRRKLLEGVALVIPVGAKGESLACDPSKGREVSVALVIQVRGER